MNAAPGWLSMHPTRRLIIDCETGRGVTSKGGITTVGRLRSKAGVGHGALPGLLLAALVTPWTLNLLAPQPARCTSRAWPLAGQANSRYRPKASRGLTAPRSSQGPRSFGAARAGFDHCRIRSPGGGVASSD